MRWMVCAALMCSCAVLSASAPPPPGVLHAILVKGNHLYSSEDLIKECGLKPGQRVTGPIIEQARKKLQDTELFNNVSDEYRFSASNPPEYDLTFQVVENTQLFPMRFERLGVSPDAIREYLRKHVEFYSDQIPGAEGVLRRYKQAVQEFVRQTHPSVEVKAAITNDDPQQLTVLFTPDTPAPTISQVIVSGNQAVDTGTILRAVNRVAVGVPLSDERIKMVLNGAIKPLYAAKGYAAVSFPKVETEPSKSNLGVILKVQIQDGPVFQFGAIRFHGNGMDEEEIRSTIPFKPGQPYNGDQVDNFRLKMLHSFRRRGFLDASITTDAAPDDSKRTVNVTYNVIPGEIYNFGKLDIQGLDITSEPVIEKLWGEKPGRPFNPDYPDFFLKRVQQQGIFDNLADTHSDYTADASSHNVIVHLYFKGGKSRAQAEKEKEQKRNDQTVDGTWSPWPPFR